jgi:uncharacterized protein
MKINSDLNRFKNIIRGKVKSNLDKFISSNDLIAQQGNKTIKIPSKYIDLPRFKFGNNEGNSSEGSSGKGKAGDETVDHEFTTDFSPEELATLIMEHLNLPDLQDKGKGKVNSKSNKYNSISNVGSEALRHNKRTFKEALKRDISSGTYNPLNPKIIPIRDDKKYKSSSKIDVPETNAAIIYIIDCSGSMTDEYRYFAKAVSFWTDLILRKSYGEIESVFIAHDYAANEINREDFFKISSAGGTLISSAYKLCSKIIQERYNFSEWNNYILHFSDSDNFSDLDNELCIKILKEEILPNCNAFNFGETKSGGQIGDFAKFLIANFEKDTKVSLSRLSNNDDILKTIKVFFEKGN